jgi:hypothetical protein
MKFYDDVRSRLGHRQSGFDYIFDFLKQRQNPLIVETGCARQENNYEGDGQSSLMFDKYISEYGGDFYTVDLAKESVQYCQSKVSNKTTVVESDSITYLKKLNQHFLDSKRKIDFLYLDSFDAPRDEPDVVYMSALHHLYELLTIAPSLSDGALIGVDDNWIDNGKLAGKGQFVFDYMQKSGRPLCHDGYQLFWKW